MARLTAQDLLLAPRLNVHDVASVLSPYGFKDVKKADANLQAIADDPKARQLLADIIDELLFGLAGAADPDQALTYLERFTRAAINKIHLLSFLKESPHTLELLAKTFGGSPFMAEILIRNPLYLYWVADPDVLYQQRKKKEMAQDLSRALRHLATEEKKLDTLRIFKRREILHIGIRDLLRLSTVEETLASLSALASILISAAYRICELSMRRHYGTACHQDASGRKVRTAFTVLGLGKLGGSELNFSSDVDLIYLYASDDGMVSPPRASAGAASLSQAEYFERLAKKLTAALSQMTNEGYVYRVDLRLRPEGRRGYIAASPQGFQNYYATRGQSWERLALLKAWPVAGNRSLGMNFLRLVRPFIYGQPVDRKTLDEIRNIKAKINRMISSRGQLSRHVKLGWGGIREIEFIVQALQIGFGKNFPHIRERNTLKALRALRKQQLISEPEYRHLSQAYVFLRDIENKLQMVEDFQTHAIPADADAL